MIPKLHYISQGATPEKHLENIQIACTHGVELVQLRLKNTDEKTILETAIKAREITAHFQTRLIINDFYKIAKEAKADGVHLGKTDTCITTVRNYLGKYYTIGSTANTLEDCKNLIDKQVDYIGLGPFRFTKTKENLSPVIGLDGYLNIIKELKTDIPIIAIGGITLDDVSEIMNTKVHGIAVSGEITRNFSTISKFNKILNADSIKEQVWKPKQDH